MANVTYLPPYFNSEQVGTGVHSCNRDHNEPLPLPDALRGYSIVDLVDEGWAIIPIIRGTKHPPKGLRWEQYRREAPSRNQVERWQREYPDSNWALLTGSISGIMAVDVDGGKAQHWCDTMGTFFKEAEPVWYSTGRKCGYQYLFKLPDLTTGGLREYGKREEFSDTIKRARASIEGGKVVHSSMNKQTIVNPYPGVEIRMNSHYSLIPPSIHPNGRAYEWQRFGSIPDAPGWILEILQSTQPKYTPGCALNSAPRVFAVHKKGQGHTRQSMKPAPTVSTKTMANGKVMESLKFFTHRAFGPGYRNTVQTSLTFAMRLDGYTCSAALSYLQTWSKRHIIGDDYTPLRDVVRSVYNRKKSLRLSVKKLMSIRDTYGWSVHRYPALLACEASGGNGPARRKSVRELKNRPRCESFGRVLNTWRRGQLTGLTNAKAAEECQVAYSSYNTLKPYIPLNSKTHRHPTYMGFIRCELKDVMTPKYIARWWQRAPWIMHWLVEEINAWIALLNSSIGWSQREIGLIRDKMAHLRPAELPRGRGPPGPFKPMKTAGNNAIPRELYGIGYNGRGGADGEENG